MPYRPNYVPAYLTARTRPVPPWTSGMPLVLLGCLGLNGVETPGGKMVLVWNNGQGSFGQMTRLAVLDAPHLLAVDGAVTADMVRLMHTTTGSDWSWRPSIMELGGELVVTIMHTHPASPSVHTVKVYVADDAEDPVAWEERGTIVSGSYTPGTVGNNVEGGSIYQMESGRWVFSGGWVNGGSRSGVFYSDDRGASWTNAIADTWLTSSIENQTSSWPAGQYTSQQIELHPRTGRLLFMNNQTVEGGFVPYAGPGSVWGATARWYSSTDGATWTYRENTPSDPGILVYSPFVHTDTQAYALTLNGGIEEAGDRWANAPVPGDTSSRDWAGALVGVWPEWWPPQSVAQRVSKRGIVTQAGDAYMFTGDKYVTSLFQEPPPPSTWIVGSIGFSPPDLCA
jgi:hypothetical protein